MILCFKLQFQKLKPFVEIVLNIPVMNSDAPTNLQINFKFSDRGPDRPQSTIISLSSTKHIV